MGGEDQHATKNKYFKITIDKIIINKEIFYLLSNHRKSLFNRVYK